MLSNVLYTIRNRLLTIRRLKYDRLKLFLLIVFRSLGQKCNMWQPLHMFDTIGRESFHHRWIFHIYCMPKLRYIYSKYTIH